MSRHGFLAGLVVAGGAALLFPGLGRIVRSLRIPEAGIFLAFFFTGLRLQTRSIPRQMRRPWVLLAAVGSSLLLVPVLAHFLARRVFPAHPDFVAGTVLIAASPVTVVSGTVMTALALGDVALSLLICAACHFAALLTMPYVTAGLLRADRAIDMPVPEILAALALTVLLPTVLGQILRPRAARHFGSWTDLFSQGVVLLIVFNAVSAAADRLAGLGATVAGLAGFMVLLHGLVLALNFGISRVLRLDPPATAAFTLHVSQKTLTVSYLVWAEAFSDAYPLALLPGIAYHLTQSLLDPLIARGFRRRAQRAGPETGSTGPGQAGTRG